MRNLVSISYLACASAIAQPILKVSSPAWQGLSEHERIDIQQKYVIESVPGEGFGIIIDAQGVNRSTPGSNAGSTLGEVVGSATYIDKAFNSGNYSAKNHLGAILLGGLLGAALDTKAQTLFQFRYAIKNGLGNITYQDAYSSDPFRHSLGVCVLLPELTVTTEQHLCTQTTNTLRDTYLNSAPATTTINDANQSATRTSATPVPNSKTPAGRSMCKIGNLAPVETTMEKCKAVNGVILND